MKRRKTPDDPVEILMVRENAEKANSALKFAIASIPEDSRSSAFLRELQQLRLRIHLALEDDSP